MNKVTKVQFGCGLSNPEGWYNFDSSPTLKFQRMLFFGMLFKRITQPSFPDNIVFGDVIKGLPLKDGSVDLLYSSHVLEHLSYDDFIIALKNSFKVLKKGGVFRIVMPDLKQLVDAYLENKQQNNPLASVNFINNTLMGVKSRDKSIKSLVFRAFGNTNHLWLWDYESTEKMLKEVGFESVRKCAFNDSSVQDFKEVESEDRFVGSLAIEAIK